MRFRAQNLFLALATLIASTCGSFAGQVTVEPILLEVNAPGAAAALKLRNDDDAPVSVQTRAQRWTQSPEGDKLEPTTDVVSSPPIVTMAPKSEYVVRVVRLSKQPVKGEETYRVLVDQLPSDRRLANPTVRLLIRQSIPLFFRGADLEPAKVIWSVSAKGGAVVVSASNQGDVRLRIAALRLRDASGRTISFGDGLIGYVLGRSSVRWQTSLQGRAFDVSRPVSVFAQTDRGALQTVAK